MSTILEFPPVVPQETARDHVANAAQMLLLADEALTRLGLIDNATSDATELREALHAASRRCLKALYLMGNS